MLCFSLTDFYAILFLIMALSSPFIAYSLFRLSTKKETIVTNFEYSIESQKLAKSVLREKYIDFLEVSIMLLTKKENSYIDIVAKYDSFRDDLHFKPKIEELSKFTVVECLGRHFGLIEFKDWKDDDDNGRLKALVNNYIENKGGRVNWADYDKIEERFANETTGYGSTHEPAGFFILHILDELQKILEPYNAQLIDVVNGGDCYNVAIVDNEDLLTLGKDMVGYYGLISTQTDSAKRDAKWKNI
jgi:hypothetical protein